VRAGRERAQDLSGLIERALPAASQLSAPANFSAFAGAFIGLAEAGMARWGRLPTFYGRADGIETEQSPARRWGENPSTIRRFLGATIIKRGEEWANAKRTPKAFHSRLARSTSVWRVTHFRLARRATLVNHNTPSPLCFL
jgi:hypothetical protein